MGKLGGWSWSVINGQDGHASPNTHTHKIKNKNGPDFNKFLQEGKISSYPVPLELTNTFKLSYFYYTR